MNMKHVEFVVRLMLASFLLFSIGFSAANPVQAEIPTDENFTPQVEFALSSTGFSDVPDTHWAAPFIVAIKDAGITSGCGPNLYCPNSPVYRGDMAIFLERGMKDSTYTPPAATGIFADVALAAYYANWVEQLYADGVTGGCSVTPLKYCPSALVTRAQMAVFLLKAKHGKEYQPPAATGIFSDVVPGSFFEPWIEQLAAEGITAGCGGDKYCPSSAVTRAQMAVFLTRTFLEEDQYKQAPMLDGMGLPPVKERLPINPLVTIPYESVGKYGGTLHTASWWGEYGNVQLYFAGDAPIKWKSDLTGYEPALVESFEWSADGKTFTLHMREGLKWSDGAPYTSADWQFYWEDMAKNSNVGWVSVPVWLRQTDGSPIVMEYPDEYTVVWKSDTAQWIAPYYMAQGFWEFAKNMMKPAHYLMQYHPDYQAGATYEDLEAVDTWWQAPGYPCLFAWCVDTVANDGSHYSLVRNPYFWRVDTQGHQLPYIDYLDIEIVSDGYQRLLNCADGRYDTGFRICGSPMDIPFLMAQAAVGDYQLLTGWMNGAGAWPGYMVNQYYVEGGGNYADDTPERAAEIRALLRNANFRRALSLGFNRQDVIDEAWNGIGNPQAATISPQSFHFASSEGQQVFDEWASMYVDLDLIAANDLLDGLGMTVVDGKRTLAGEPFTLIIEISDWGGSYAVQVDAAAEMEAQWEQNLSLDVEILDLQGQPELDTRTSEGWYMLRGAHISELDIWTYPDWLFPIYNRYAFSLEGRWYQMGKDSCVPAVGEPYSCGVKPEVGSPAYNLQALYEAGLAEPDLEKRHEIVWDAIRILIDEGPFVIGVADDQQMPVVIKNHMRNIMDFGVLGPWAPATPGNQVTSQWWIDK
jgi:peptide/nickel transport system substrate-binding protein